MKEIIIESIADFKSDTHGDFHIRCVIEGDKGITITFGWPVTLFIIQERGEEYDLEGRPRKFGKVSFKPNNHHLAGVENETLMIHGIERINSIQLASFAQASDVTLTNEMVANSLHHRIKEQKGTLIDVLSNYTPHIGNWEDYNAH